MTCRGWNDGHSRNCENYWIIRRNIDAKTPEDLDKAYHKDRSLFQCNFSGDVKKVYDGFNVNPFEKINLVNISNTSKSYDDKQESH